MANNLQDATNPGLDQRAVTCNAATKAARELEGLGIDPVKAFEELPGLVSEAVKVLGRKDVHFKPVQHGREQLADLGRLLQCYSVQSIQRELTDGEIYERGSFASDAERDAFCDEIAQSIQKGEG